MRGSTSLLQNVYKNERAIGGVALARRMDFLISTNLKERNFMFEQKRWLRRIVMKPYVPKEFTNYDLLSNIEGVTNKFRIEFNYLMKIIWKPHSKPWLIRNILNYCQNHVDIKLLLIVWDEWIKRNHELDLCTQTMMFEKILRYNNDNGKKCIELLTNYEKYRISPASSHFDYLFTILLRELDSIVEKEDSTEEMKNEVIKSLYQVFGLALFYGITPGNKAYESLILTCKKVGTYDSKKYSGITKREYEVMFLNAAPDKRLDTEDF